VKKVRCELLEFEKSEKNRCENMQDEGKMKKSKKIERRKIVRWRKK